ncbi:ligand-effect modulator 3 family [Apiospora rasikravindrae]|uniref:Ligand-effect modulator 3 family n=1 Tax=Apiospora rasikravindrae TaxID=990691 RepID=A0ABR1UCM1_9PEZI
MSDSPPGAGRTDSISSQQHDGDKSNEKKKSRRPANTAFRQQRLKAWQPILTPKTVLPLFFAIGIIFAPIGGLLLYASSLVQELRLDYTHCFDQAPNSTEFKPMDNKYVMASFKNSNTSVNAMWRRETTDHFYPAANNTLQNQTRCILQFDIPEDMKPPVLFYYRLTNFYQNHRRYVSSFMQEQLKGTEVSVDAVLNSPCKPLAGEGQQAYYPCGLVANSLFNDTFANPVKLTTGNSNPNETYFMSQNNIAWASDKDLYGKPESLDYEKFIPPPNWQLQYPGGHLKNDEHFMVWMRTAGLPTFSKLYMRSDNATMGRGTYSLSIISNFRTDVFQGEKAVVITTRTVIGGKNNFLGIAYVVVGGICIVLGVVFTVTHLIKPRKLGDHTYLSWNNAPGGAKTNSMGGPAVGMSTGRDVA